MTAEMVDVHVHYICPQQIEEALYSGVTTMMGGGTGPAVGTNTTTCWPGRGTFAGCCKPLVRGFPMNLGFYGKGNASLAPSLVEQIEAGACG